MKWKLAVTLNVYIFICALLPGAITTVWDICYNFYYCLTDMPRGQFYSCPYSITTVYRYLNPLIRGRFLTIVRVDLLLSGIIIHHSHIFNTVRGILLLSRTIHCYCTEPFYYCLVINCVPQDSFTSVITGFPIPRRKSINTASHKWTNLVSV